MSQQRQLFTATHWSVVLEAKAESSEALNRLCVSYRTPLIIWLRSRGATAEDAEDSVQGFFEHLLQRDWLNSVARDKGRFRTFLLTAFRNYLRDRHQRSGAAKRGRRPVDGVARRER